ncbi:MAG TPA: nickel-dependent hydrogenase large subunit [Candidatus Deferrimicrobium sp.]|nr:nickel-dependent hydrogenase large subunit [Candidatus Deferrimicrobium sp.]
MGQRIIVDPLTRIEGHLKIEVEVENGVVKDAWSTGSMFRGLETLLVKRDPRDATYVTERVCGVCAGSHGTASSFALDQAFGAKVPTGGRLLRNLILGAMWLHDHPLHFYHLSALDYIDVMKVAEYKGNDPGLLAVKDKIVKLATAGDTAPLTPRYQPDEFSVTDPELVTTAVAHYIKALEMQAKAKKMSAIFAGKQPHQSSIVVGGVTVFPKVEAIATFASMLEEQISFIENVYVKDVLTFGTGPLLKLAQLGVGAGHGHYMTYGGFPIDDKGTTFFKSGVIFDNDFAHVQKLDASKIYEDVKHSWYKSASHLHPSKGETEADTSKDAYSFIKSPRYDGKPMEVGPLARMLVEGNETLMGLVKQYNIKPGAVARHAARAIETVKLANEMRLWVEQLKEELGKGIRIHDTDHWEPPTTGEGAGLTEAPRGALGHWISVKDGLTANYQMVVPSTWNFGPRDDKEVRGPIEQALIGTPVPDVNNPINVARVVRSYDPCISCAVHLIDPTSNEIRKFQIG